MDYRHTGVKRKNNPEEGLATYLPEEKITRKFVYDSHLDPQLMWAGKAEHTSFVVPVVPLHIHERITPKIVASLLKKRVERQAKLFDETHFPLDKRIDFYRHDIDWANRLILGDSLVVMTSLLTKELMGGQVQMIYVDPPYGISYASNFQPTMTNIQVKDGDDKSLTREPEQVKAYRDTWELGIHSYLTYLKDRMLLAWELLSDSGSIFVQINDQNLHHVKELLDEVFKPENFCSIICLQKTSGLGSKLLRRTFDYILWYAKKKNEVKFHQLYLKKEIGEEGGTHYDSVELPDGTRRHLTPEEMANQSLLPVGSRVFTTGDLTSQGNPPVAFKFEGKTYTGGWKTNLEGMQRLAKARRIATLANTLRYIRYIDDFPLYPLTDYWPLGGIQSRTDPKIYVVQTTTTAIQYCMLMTTDPGDIVLDPTCGSGTTAMVAEHWGRRWITCDTSRVALSLARQRILTAAYPFYRLAHADEGPRSGFQYETVSRTTLRSIAQDEKREVETLYDKPLSNDEIVRVSGPFTVEGIPSPTIRSSDDKKEVEEAATSAGEYVSAMVQALRTSGIVLEGGRRLRLDNLVPISTAGFVHAEGVSQEDSAKVAVSFGPRYGSLGVKQAEEAIRTATANAYAILILAGFHIDPATQSFVERTNLKVKVQFVAINPDMEIHNLLKPHQASQLFTAYGEPDVELVQCVGNQVRVSLKGVDIYDPVTGEASHNEADNLPAWFLDENYDGYSFNICQAFFPDGATKLDPWDKLERALRGSVDKERMNQFKGTVSLPFEIGPQGMAAVKVIDARGSELIKLIKLQGK